MENLLSKVYLGPMGVLWSQRVENLLTKVYLDPGVHHGPGVNRGPGAQGEGQGHALEPTN